MSSNASQDQALYLEMLRKMLLIRRFDEAAVELVERGEIVGIVHTYIGEEAVAVGACAAFGATCGSSLATAATMGQVALPELRRFGYSGRLAT